MYISIRDLPFQSLNIDYLVFNKVNCGANHISHTKIKGSTNKIMLPYQSLLSTSQDYEELFDFHKESVY